jgi:acetoin utilization deacetylase AcuC-like enzyme
MADAPMPLPSGGRPSARGVVLVYSERYTFDIGRHVFPVFTFSMHQIHNYPATKPASSLDVGLVDGVSDVEDLHALRESLPKVFAFDPEIVFYLAGADPYAGNQLGGLSLSMEGLRERDRLVFESARRHDVPVVVTLAGGYARRVDDTVEIHVATVEAALAALGQGRPRGQAGHERGTPDDTTG